MGGIRLLLGPLVLRPPPARFEFLLDRAKVQAQGDKECRSRATVTQQTEHDVLGPDGIVFQSSGLEPSIFQRTLGVRAKRVRIDAGWRM